MPRRGESIWKRKDGRWEARYIKGRDAANKAVYGSVYGKTYNEVKRKREEVFSTFKTQKSLSTYRHVLFERVIGEFLDEHRFAVKDSTYVRYIEIADNHLYPELGAKSILSFSQDDANQYIVYLLTCGKGDGTGLAPKSVKDIISVLKLIFKYAQKKEYIPNSIISFTVPKQPKAEIQVLSPSQRKKLEAFVTSAKDTYMFGVFLCLYTGLRIGELCALQWSDIDLVNSIISISKTVIRIKNIQPGAAAKTRLIIDSPKTPSSKRKIPIPAMLTRMLSEIRGLNTSDNDYILTGQSKFIEPRNYYQRYKKYLDKCEIGCFNFHVLRHPYVKLKLKSPSSVLSPNELFNFIQNLQTVKLEPA